MLKSCQLSCPGFGVLFELFDPSVVSFHGVPQDGVFNGCHFLVKLDATHPVQPFHIQVALPPDANTVEDERRLDVDL